MSDARLIAHASLARNISTSLMLKAGAIIVGLLTIPAYIDYFENDALLGIWFSLLAILNWGIFFDFGLGNGLKNYVIMELAEKREWSARSAIKNSAVLMAIIGVGLVLIGVALETRFEFFTNIFSESKALGDSESRRALFVLAGVFVLQFPLRIAIALLFALQKSALANIAPLATQSIIFLFMIVFDRQDFSDAFLALVIAYGIAVLSPLLLSWGYLLSIVRRWEKKNDIVTHGLRPLMKDGALFFWVQLCLLAINSTNEYLILVLHSAAEVVPYQVHFRIYSVVLVAFSTFALPLWSAIGQAVASGATERIARLVGAMRIVVALCVLTSIGISVAMPLFLRLWLGVGTVVTSVPISTSFAAYISVMTGIMYATTIANGFNRLKGQVISLSAAVAIKFWLVWLYPDANLGWEGVVIITTIALLPALGYLVLDARRIIMQSR